MIVTTLPASVLLPKLREALVGQVVELQGGLRNVRGAVHGCLENIAISRVFDFEGLWEVVEELDAAGVDEWLPEGAVDVAHLPVVKTEPELLPDREVAPEKLPVAETVGEQHHSPEVVPERLSVTGTDHEPPPGSEVNKIGQPLHAIPKPDSSPLSSPPPSYPVDPPEETVSTLPELRNLPERIVPPVRTGRLEILDSEDVPDSSPPESSPLSSPPPSSPPASESDEAELPSKPPVSEVPDSETESPDPGSIERTESIISEARHLQPELLSPQPRTPDARLLEPEPEPEPEPDPEPEPNSKEIPQKAEHIAPHQAHEGRKVTPQRPSPPRPLPLPDVILITHTSTLLNTLFTGRDKPTAHSRMSQLSSKLRHLTRSPSHGSPLIMLLNSLTIPFSAELAAHNTNDYSPAELARPPLPREADPFERPRNLPEPTLRSVFGSGSGAGLVARRAPRGKPSFGVVFTQLLDLHLLCTRVPRVAGGGVAWVVEVLLDEIGVYEMGGDEGVVTRRCREQRWGAVDIEGGGGRVLDAFR